MKTLDLSRIGAVYIACGYTDMHHGINGLAAQVQQQFRLDPRQQAVFLFCGKRSDRFKALFWDGDGFVLLYKRLENGRYQWSRTREEEQQLTEQQYRWLMEGLSTVVLRAVEKRDKRFSAHWLCRCDCGNEIMVGQKQLLSGEIQNCDYRTEVRYRDIAGRRFGPLTAIHPLDQADERGSKIWRCVCDCGTELDVPYNTLLYGNTRSCGCKKRESDRALSSRVSRVAGTSIDHLKSKKIPTNIQRASRAYIRTNTGDSSPVLLFKKKQYFLGAFTTLSEAAEARREAEEVLNDQVADFYARWKQQADQAPGWAVQNPIRIEIEKCASGIQVILLPKL